jgi:hypothetical protein
VRALLVDALAVARLTRLVTKDKIADPLREHWIAEAFYATGITAPSPGLDWQQMAVLDPLTPKRASFITCPWCTSFWLAAGVVAARRLCPRLWSPVAEALAFSHLAGLGANLDVD